MSKSPRRLLQISLKPELHAAVREHCAKLDIPMAIWTRELIKQALQQLSPP